MIRLLLFAGLVAAFTFCTGCTLSRAAERCVLAIETSPIPPGGRRLDLSVMPFLYPDGLRPEAGCAKVDLTTPANARNTLQFYRDTFARRGWQETYTPPPWARNNWPDSSLVNTWCFTRVRAVGSGEKAWVLSRDLLVLQLEAETPESDTTIHITTYPLNAWDVPPRAAVTALWGVEDFLQHHGQTGAVAAYFMFLQVVQMTF